MTAVANQPSLLTRSAPTWHRPLLWLAGAMALLVVASLLGLLVDDRVLLGAPIWAKPLKFAISILIYALTLAWLTSLVTRGRRLAWWAGTIAAIGLAVEIVLIAGAALLGVTSHFNVSSPTNIAVWGAMATFIVITWSATLLVGVQLAFSRLGDRARTVAIRAGVVLALVGMAVAFFMTSPTAAQLADFKGIAGAHTVGLADGGAGLPLLGWSTIAGDLRVPHFVGMHALQVLPPLLAALELASRRLAVFRRGSVRLGIVVVAVVVYAAALAVLTAQALAGESVVQPSGFFFGAGLALVAGAVVAVAIILANGRRADARARVQPRPGGSRGTGIRGTMPSDITSASLEDAESDITRKERK